MRASDHGLVGRSQQRLGTLDWVLLGLLTAIGTYVVYRTTDQLHYQWNWSVVARYFVETDPATGAWTSNLLLDGLLATLRLSVLSIVLATLLGIPVALGRRAGRLLPRLLAGIYVEVARNTPPLVLIFIIYFFAAGRLIETLGITAWARGLDPATAWWVTLLLGPPPLLGNFLSGLLCLVVIETAYTAEIIRAGLESVERGQWEAGKALGLRPWQVMLLVVLPQAIRNAVPALAGQFVQLVKASSIVSLISVQELTFAGAQVATSTRRFFEIWLSVAGVYFVVCFLLSAAARSLERRMTRAS